MRKRTKYYCECGCGQKVIVYRGKPRRFIYGHYLRTKKIRAENSDRMKDNTLFKGGKMPESAKKAIAKSQIGKGNSNWNGGRTNDDYNNYISILISHHPYADINGRVKEERLIIEKYLGRYLRKEEIVHHINRNKQDNRIKNLQIVSSLEHGRIHHKKNKHALGYKFTKKQRKNLSNSKLGHFVSEETKQKMRKPHKPISEETKQKLSISQTGLKDSIHTKKKKSLSAKIAWQKRKKVIKC